jgi:hypothetical protein
MNIFDLKVWKKKDITGIYHKWQNMVRCWNPWYISCFVVLFLHVPFLYINS